MYGPVEDDPVVRYYDLAFGITGEVEREYYLEKMRRYGGPVLDLAGGTGRFTVEAASLGLEVTYVDSSPGMHSQLARRLADLQGEVAGRIRAVRATMADFAAAPEFPVDETFPLVICVDAFFHNLTPSAARATLELVRRVLRPDGAFVFNVHYTTPAFVCFAASEDGRAWKVRGEYEIPGSANRLTVEQSLQADFATQVITTTLRFRTTDPEAALVDERVSSWQTRSFNRFELEYLLELCGLDVVSLVGDYAGGPIGEGSQLVYECRPRPT